MTYLDVFIVTKYLKNKLFNSKNSALNEALKEPDTNRGCLKRSICCFLNPSLTLPLNK